MDSAYAAAYAKLAQHHWWWVSRRAAIRAELTRLSAADGSLRLLEVGCAGAANFPTLAPFGEVSGLEPEEQLLPKSETLRAQVTHAPLDQDYTPPHTFDRVLLLDVLEHVSEREAFLDHALRLLAPEGRMLLTVPAHSWLWTRHDRINQHQLRYSRTRLASELQAAGMRIERSTFLYQGLVLPKLATRLIESLLPERSGLPKVPPATINRALAAYFDLERSLLGPLRLPLGSSLLVVASRS
ncbi:MAG: SAM-dependent methyltransferase [Planctomycetota bacterium]